MHKAPGLADRRRRTADGQHRARAARCVQAVGMHGGGDEQHPVPVGRLWCQCRKRATNRAVGHTYRSTGDSRTAFQFGCAWGRQPVAAASVTARETPTGRHGARSWWLYLRVKHTKPSRMRIKLWWQLVEAEGLPATALLAQRVLDTGPEGGRGRGYETRPRREATSQGQCGLADGNTKGR